MSAAPPIYVLDANVFVQAHRRHYAFDICPGFWDCVIHHHHAGRVISIDRVRDEILAGDALEAWVKNSAPKTLFVSTADAVVAANFAAMVQWVQTEPQFKLEAKTEFAQVADGWLAAYAQAHPHHVVATHEEFNADAKKRVPLPNVCKKFGVEYVDPFAMLKELKASFRWVKP
ncbi:MAG: DUF4411 family protein [Verrucomicrobia bacterium]|nr:DUF4411 family protein [Verrucomicrobiota bacterium]